MVMVSVCRTCLLITFYLLQPAQEGWDVSPTQQDSLLSVPGQLPGTSLVLRSGQGHSRSEAELDLIQLILCHFLPRLYPLSTFTSLSTARWRRLVVVAHPGFSPRAYTEKRI